MIDYLSLAIGHGLLAFALFRLVMREDVDVDPAIEALKARADAEREASSVAGRNARRRAETGGDDPGAEMAQRSGAQAAKRPGAQAANRSGAQAAKR